MVKKKWSRRVDGRMAKKEQHFVPRVYIKAWETSVETSKEPNKKFQGVYVFANDDKIGEGATKESIFWKPHLYTIKFSQIYMAKKCPGVLTYYADAVYKAMVGNQPAPVYAKFGYSIIKTKNSVRKHLMEIEQWDFYYENGNLAKKQAILNRINDIRCYLLEDSFSNLFESNWEKIRDSFILEVQNGVPVSIGESERYISEKVAEDMLKFFFMMLCRSPNFDAMGIYTWLSEILRSAFDQESLSEIDEMMNTVWFSELYRMFYKNSGGFYHNVLSEAFKKCQFILFEAYSNSEMFITSDSPAFQNNCKVVVENENGYIFPLSPKYLLFIAKGNDGINVVDHRYANVQTVRHFNRIIYSNRHSKVLGIKKQLSDMI